jgi:MerR family transcriptional regulator, heat shock protein HspR
MMSDELGTLDGSSDDSEGKQTRATPQSLTKGRPALASINADKPIFTLSVAADILGLHPRTLRIYEENELVIPARTATNRRRYSQNDVKKVQFIQHLTQGKGVNLAGVKIILDMLVELEKCGVDYTQSLLGSGRKR